MSKKWIFWFEELGQEFNYLVGKKPAKLVKRRRGSCQFLRDLPFGDLEDNSGLCQERR
jgi:hypothetical protein